MAGWNNRGRCSCFCTWDVDLAFVLQVCPSQVAIQRHGPVTLRLGPYFLRVSQVLHSGSRSRTAELETKTTWNQNLTLKFGRSSERQTGQPGRRGETSATPEDGTS